MLRSLRRLAIKPFVMWIPLLVSGCGGGDGAPIGTCPGNCPAGHSRTYLPVEATPSSNPNGGPTDLYVIRSDAPGTTPTHVATYRWMLGIADVTNFGGTATRHFYTTYGEKGG